MSVQEIVIAQESALLKKIGFDHFDVGYLFIAVGILAVLILILIILVIVQICKTSKLKKRLDKFMLGKDSLSLEQNIMNLFEDNKFLRNNVDKNRKDIRDLYKRMESAFQKAGLVKYDAFNQMGGQLSFCLALLDENNNGFILNSVHSTEGCYFYSKDIKNGECSLSLSTEESEALGIAKGH